MDNRLRFQGPKFDFNSQVGLSGLDHDNYPAPGLARYDQMRMYLIALLANQSSDSPPTEYRAGTIWFDLNEGYFKAWDGTEWRYLSELMGPPPTP